MEKTKQVEVTLAKPHSHDGKSFPAGAKIKVSELERDWLVMHKIIVTTEPKEATK